MSALTKAGAVAVVTAVLLLGSACGGSADGRPSTDTISKALRAKDIGAALGSDGDVFSKKVADCIAKEIHDSDMSDKGVRDFLEGGKSFSKADTDAFREIFPTVAACSPVVVPGSS